MTGSGSSLRTDQNFITRAELINAFQKLRHSKREHAAISGHLLARAKQANLPLTPAWPFNELKVVLPQRFYLGNLNCVQHPAPASCSGGQISENTVGCSSAPAPVEPARVIIRFVGNTWGRMSLTPHRCQLFLRFPASSPPPPGFFSVHKLCALGSLSTADSTHIASTLQIGASMIDQYDDDLLTTGIYFDPGSNPDNCDPQYPPAYVRSRRR